MRVFPLGQTIKIAALFLLVIVISIGLKTGYDWQGPTNLFVDLFQYLVGGIQSLLEPLMTDISQIKF